MCTFFIVCTYLPTIQEKNVDNFIFCKKKNIQVWESEPQADLISNKRSHRSQKIPCQCPFNRSLFETAVCGQHLAVDSMDIQRPHCPHCKSCLIALFISPVYNGVCSSIPHTGHQPGLQLDHGHMYLYLASCNEHAYIIQLDERRDRSLVRKCANDSPVEVRGIHTQYTKEIKIIRDRESTCRFH